MEYARIMKEETEMDLTLEELWEMGLTRNLTQEDLERMDLARKGKWQYTTEDIEALPEWIRAELIDGELFVRMEAPATTHQDILGELFWQIKTYIKQKKGNCKVFVAPFGVYIKNGNHDFVEPDITVICDEDKLDEKGCHGAPDWVIEIVSPSGVKMDYIRKLALYQSAGVREYWIVEPKEKAVIVYDLEHGEKPAQYSFSEKIKSGIYEDLYLDLEEFL